jgi:hypothetical protein
MSAALEEVVVDPDPLDAEHLGKQRAQDRLLRRPRRPLRMRRTQSSGSGSAPAVELAVWRQRQPLQHHQSLRAPCSPAVAATARPAAPRCPARAYAATT